MNLSNGCSANEALKRGKMLLNELNLDKFYLKKIILLVLITTIEWLNKTLKPHNNIQKFSDMTEEFWNSDKRSGSEITRRSRKKKINFLAKF